MASDDFEKLGVEVEPSNIGKIIGHKGPQSEDISRIHTKICSNHHLFQMPNLNQIDVPHSIPPKNWFIWENIALNLESKSIGEKNR